MVTAVLDRSDLLEGKNEFGFQCDLRKEARVDHPAMMEVQTDLRETEELAFLACRMVSWFRCRLALICQVLPSCWLLTRISESASRLFGLVHLT